MIEIGGLLKTKERNFQSQIYDGQFTIMGSAGKHIYKNNSGFLSWVKARHVSLKNYEDEYLIFDGECLAKVKFNRVILNNRALMDKENFNYVEEINVVSQPSNKKPTLLIKKLFDLGFKELQ